jgi:hypothetical protein
MNYKQAVKLATDAIDYLVKGLNVQANLYEMYGMEGGKNDADKRKKMREAKEILLSQQRMNI